MNTPQESNAQLPVRHSLTLPYYLSFSIALLSAVASIAGLITPGAFYPTGELRRDLAPMAVINLCLALPVLLGSLALARQRRLIGLLCWPGALFFNLYIELIFLFALPFNAAFLLHLVLVALGVYTLLGLVASIDGEAVQRRLSGAVFEKVMGVVLAGQGLLNFGWVAFAILYKLAAGSPGPEAAFANHVTDVLIAPAWIIGGVLLWRRQALGYATGLGLLLQGSLLVLGMAVISLLQSFTGAAHITPIKLGLVFSGALVCFIPFTLYARGVGSRCSASPPILLS